MNVTAETRRAANAAAHAALSEAHSRLPASTRDLIKTEYRLQLAKGGKVSWGKFLAVALPMLPDDAPR